MKRERMGRNKKPSEESETRGEKGGSLGEKRNG